MNNKYSDSFKRKLVKMYFNGRNARRIYEAYNIPKRTFYYWVEEYRTIYRNNGTIITAHDYKMLQAENEKIQRQLEVYQKAGCSQYSDEHEKLKAIKRLQGKYPIKYICDILNIDRGKYYRYITHIETINEKRDKEFAPLVKEIFEEHKARYGAKRICAELQRRGHVISIRKVSQLMKEQNLIVNIGEKPNNRNPIPYDKRNPNLLALKKKYALQGPDVAWLSDITEYTLTNGLKIYLCVVEDIASRYVISYNISTKPDTKLLVSTFQAAFEKRNRPSGLIFHSDQGTIYKSTAFHAYLKSNGVMQSFSRVGSPHDNAHMESFFATLKKEELYRKEYNSYEEFCSSVAAYVDYYNNKRLHSCLGYKTPKAVLDSLDIVPF